jgi:hypothetical protein
VAPDQARQRSPDPAGDVSAALIKSDLMTSATQAHILALLRASREERSEAVEALLISLEDLDEEQVDQQTWERLWAAELERRIQANEPGIPGEQVFAELRAKLQSRRKSG